MARKNEAIEEAVEEVESGEPRVYELGFHIDPELPAEEVKKTYQEIRDRVAQAGTIVAEGEPLQIQLAYTISRQETTGRRDFNTAHFAWVAYEADAAAHAAVVEQTGTDRRVIRFIDLRTTKEAAQHAQDLRDMALKTAAREEAELQEEEGESSDLDAALETATV